MEEICFFAIILFLKAVQVHTEDRIQSASFFLCFQTVKIHATLTF